MVATSIATADVRVVHVKCGISCRLDVEPALGERVVIAIDSGERDAQIARIVSGVPRACADPCALEWPGLADVVVVTGGTVKNLDVAKPPRFGKLPPAIGLGGNELAKPAFGYGDHEPIFVIGGEETPTIVERPQAEPSGDPDDLDTYLDDVVLVTSKTLGCTGVAVGARSVVTARHCVGATQVGVERENRRIESFIVVGRTSPPDPRVDVTLLVVDRDLHVALRPRATTPTALPATGIARLVGFGTTDVNGRFGFGLKRQVFVGVASWACDAISVRASGCIPDQEISFASDAADTCLGDSGGPVLDVVDGRWRLVAIASRGIPGFGAPCGHGGIYTHVGAFTKWLKTELVKEAR